MRTTVSPDGLKVYNTADRQACVALQAGRLSASPVLCSTQRSIASSGLPKAGLHVAAGRSPMCVIS